VKFVDAVVGRRMLFGFNARQMNVVGFRGQTVAKQEALILIARVQRDRKEPDGASHKFKHAEYGFASPISCLCSALVQSWPSSVSVL